MRPRAVVLFGCWALLVVAASPARAEIAVMESGKILYVDRFERVDEEITLYVTGGGVVTVPSEIVLNVVPNEVVEEGEDPQKVRLFPQLEEFIAPAASKYGVAPELVAAVIWAESSGDPNATSHRGARGLMQLMPETATELGVTTILDPRENVEGGTRYLRQMLDAHEGDVSLALAAYNAGPEAVRRYRGIPPYRETREYVGRVIRVYERALGGVE
ncbi:MAG TPA: lytic transglycosylase domain-containing protein [Vicinamibacteria bacterium]|nr:lytic transglycosylase domain-containing protein [Vicinamibacteria bacterium]